jgi:hypothetical protein
MNQNKPPFNRTPKNNMEAMMLLIWLVKTAPDEKIELAIKKIEEHEKRCTKEEIDQAMLNMKEFNYFIKPGSE